MGLAASQARLLTITSRKSRAQFESMRYSHQRLALSRNLTDISNEYQKSLDQTKLYYDFYGVNSTDTPLTYGLLMSPSSLNDYTPTLISNNQGRIILSSPYAAAAKAAGVPPEGLGCTPSSLMRNAFVQSLAQNGIITQATADSICAIDYNQGAGLGNDNLVNTITETGGFDMLINALSGTGAYQGVYLRDMIMAGPSSNPTANQAGVNVTIGAGRNYINTGNGYDFGGTDNDGDPTVQFASLTLADLLNGGHHIMLTAQGGSDRAKGWYEQYDGLVLTTQKVCEQLGNALMSILDGSDSRIQEAVAYAHTHMADELWARTEKPESKPENFGQKMFDWLWGNKTVETEENYYTQSLPSECTKESNEARLYDDATDYAEDYMGLINIYRSKPEILWWQNEHEAIGALDLTNFTKAWFTYFMQALAGFASPEANSWNIIWRADVADQKFADAQSLKGYKFQFATTTVSDNEALIANFYDTLFNQICANGWTENNQVAEDSSYLKEMLQTGMMYVTSMSDDYYYYQNNYATNTFIKEVSDDAAIAAAESKYRTEKARINAKEQEIDLKMKNLDTEISSLETEYEAVKKVIEGNVSKSFTRYDS